MKRLEEKFGDKHPDLARYKPLHPALNWLQASFFRLHRRRQVQESGLQPLSFREITHFADRVIELPKDLVMDFTYIMEVTDQAVIHDYYKTMNKR